MYLTEDLPYCAAGQRLSPAPGSGEAPPLHHQAGGLQELHRLDHQLLKEDEGVRSLLAKTLAGVVRKEVPVDLTRRPAGRIRRPY